jgi:excisionase family DNA binding protein
MAKPKTTKQTSAGKKTAKPKAKPAPKADKAPAPSTLEAQTGPAPAQAELIGLEELAEQLRLPAMRIRQMLRAGQIQGVKVDGQWRFNAKLVFQALGRRARGR